MKKLLLLVIVMLACWKVFGPDTVIKLGPGVMIDEIPLQTKPKNATSFKFLEYTITPLADISLTAKILSKTNYLLGREAELSPVDLALGWQNMSDESVLENITISQSNRWYVWKTQDFPISRKEIETQSANMHMVPANDQVKKALAKVKQGQIITLSGHLIRVDSNEGWHWQSSLTREDIGTGACELIYVKDFKLIQ